MQKINYSIIIPHHNTPTLLQRLLSSIPQRNDLEIIIVDDNSNCSIVDFSKFPGKDRKNVICVFDKKGGGGGYARNVGIKKATGKWIIFADSDDFFNFCFIDILDQYIESEYDIIFFKSNSLHSDYYTTCDRDYFTNRHIPIRNAKDEKYLRFLYGEPWGKIIRRSIIINNNILFDETFIHNDTTFSYLVGFYAKTVFADERAMYCVTFRTNSVSKQTSFEKELTRIEVFARAKKFYEENKLGIDPVFELPFRQLLKFFVNFKKFKQGIIVLSTLGYSSFEICWGLVKNFFLIILRKFLSFFGKDYILN